MIIYYSLFFNFIIILTYINCLKSNNTSRKLQQGKTWDIYNISQFIHSSKETERIAIILTGELRSSNLTWGSGHIKWNRYSANFGPDDPYTPAGTIIEWILKPLSLNYILDVFMFQTVKKQLKNNYQWNNEPNTYENQLNDYRGCEIFASNELFQFTSNKFFCLIEEEEILMNNFIKKFPRWLKNDNLNFIHPEQILQQLYALYRGNLGSKQYALANNINYKYKIRLRPDMAIGKEFPSMTTFDFGSRPLGVCKTTIYYSNKDVYNNGAEDSFNIGYSYAMDKLLDRYLNFISEPFITRFNNDEEGNIKHWNLEDHLIGLMNKRYKICMESHPDIWMFVIRKDTHQYRSPYIQEPKQHLLWKELSS